MVQFEEEVQTAAEQGRRGTCSQEMRKELREKPLLIYSGPFKRRTQAEDGPTCSAPSPKLWPLPLHVITFSEEEQVLTSNQHTFAQPVNTAGFNYVPSVKSQKVDILFYLLIIFSYNIS